MECEIYNKAMQSKLMINDYVTEMYQTNGQPKGNYFFIKLDGLGEVEADRQTMDSNRDGTIFIESTLAERDIQIELIMIADEFKSMEELRREMSKMLNPKSGTLELRYKEDERSYRIDVQSAHVPTFKTDGYLSKKAQRVTLDLIASDPFWYAVEDEIHYLSNWEPNLEWELEFPMTGASELGIELERFNGDQLVTLVNDGDEATGMELYLTASGDVKNPEIIRVMADGTMTQKMKLLTTIHAGDLIRITTSVGNKRIEKWNDTQQFWENIFNTLSLDSQFIQLDIGENYLRYQTESHADQLEIKVHYRLRYVGV